MIVTLQGDSLKIPTKAVELTAAEIDELTYTYQVDMSGYDYVFIDEDKVYAIAGNKIGLIQLYDADWHGKKPPLLKES